MTNTKTKNQSLRLIYFLFLIYSLPLLSKTNPSLKRIGNEVIYLIMVDRFHNGNLSNDFPISTATSELDKMLLYRMMDPTQGQDYTRHFGGDLRGVIDKLDYLRDLGVTMLWLTPVIENTNAKLEGGGFSKTSYHGYWGKNWFKLDPHLKDPKISDLDLMSELVQKAHSKGIKIILDLVLNHSSPINGVDRGGIYGPNGKLIADGYQDEQNFFRRSFDKTPFPIPNWYHYGDVPWYKDRIEKNDLTHFMLDGLLDFNTENPIVREYLFSSVKLWLSYGVDGFRIDTLKHLEVDFIQEFEKIVLDKNPHAILIGEYFGGGSDSKESQDYLEQTSRLTIFDFNFRDSLYEAFHPKKRNLPNLNKLIQQLNKDSKYRSEFATFLDNHDYPRFLSDSGDEISFLAALSVLFTMPGAPTLFYGNEFQVFDTKERTGFMGQIGGDPFNRPKMIFDSESKSQFTEKLKQLIQLRSKYTHLQDGNINARLKINSPYYTSEIDYELTIQNKSSKNNSCQFILTRIHFDSKLNIKKISIEDSSKTILLEYNN